jgi:O-antigen ligase
MTLAPAIGARAPSARDRGTVLDHAEVAFVFLTILLMSQALLPAVFAPEQPNEGPPWMRMMWFPIYGGTLLFAMLRLERMASVWITALATAPLIALAFISSEWSLLPDVSSRRALALTFTTAFGLYLAARFSWARLAEVVAAAFLLMALGSVVAALAFPSLGVESDIHAGAWKGLWLQKNAMGAAMVRGLLACACAAILVPERRTFWAAAAALCAGLVLLSTSMTAFMGMVVCLGSMAGVRMLRSGGLGVIALLWLALLGSAALLAAVVLAPDQFFALIGKDPTLTGRTDIWDAVLRRVAAEPGGHGFAAFWTAEQGPALYIQEEADWEVPNAHNGWLELLLWFGWTGVWMFAAHFALAVAATGRRLWSADGGAYWAVPVMLLFGLFSLSESTIMQWNNLSWVIYVATLAKLLQVATGPDRRTAAAP